jgi:competence protein ComEC
LRREATRLTLVFVNALLTAQAQPGALAFSRAGAAALLEAQHGRFAPWLAVSLGAGVLAYFSVRAEPGVWWLWAAASLLGISALVARRGAAIAWLVALVGAAALGFGGSAWHAARMPPPLVLPMGAVLVSGEISRVDLLPEGGRRVTFRAPRLDGGAPLQRTLRVRLRANDPARPAAGDRLAVRALVRPPSAPGRAGGMGLPARGLLLGPWRQRVRPRHGRGDPWASGTRPRSFPCGRGSRRALPRRCPVRRGRWPSRS